MTETLPEPTNVSSDEDTIGLPAGEKTTPNEVEDLSEGWRNPGWLSVISLFLVNFAVFGIVFTWGIFQNVYLTEVFPGQTDSFRISFVGTLSATFIVGGGILVAPLVQYIGHRTTMLIGGFLSPLGLISASFVTAPWQLYLSEGVLFGLGGCLLYNPSVYLPAQWFKKNRALATGLGVCGTGIGGLALSLITEKLVATVGFRMTLRYLGIICWVLLMVACALARIRWPATGLKNYQWIDTSILTFDFVIYMFFGGTVIISYATPFFLLPQYAASIGVSSADASTVIGVMSACNAVSRVLLGYLADRFGRINAMFLVTFLAGLFMMVVWIEVTSIGTLYAIGVLYGLTGGGFLALIPAVTAELVPVKNISQGMNFLFLSMVPGGLLGTPISGLLRDQAGFTAAIEFAGATTVLSALILLVLRQRRANNKIFIKI
ncbi:hypothetical protein K450DRAFT_279412 [Umbelopsis ramanniana AG]|uniref:Major facilitator superfamily (MFS) profile domain-containing protein n=1 Tax=Umbelopsis ramanniana AG TaxID=1314678 RepID=A0AAD5EEY1_UMBRA|nr:uncharacterized protein K450DRAFT_279412 [Umbelopsis ramanniana AG]KAI8581020.1 hypothetical protein K450DRAFT_279412 [Umbelopsis ramanniana AG]